jgi:hypothetical protein
MLDSSAAAAMTKTAELTAATQTRTVRTHREEVDIPYLCKSAGIIFSATSKHRRLKAS